MKIIRGNKIYVQAEDIAVLADSDVYVPKKVVEAIFRDYDYKNGARTKSLDRYICFEGPDAIKFFTDQDWIINYDSIQSVGVDAISELSKTNLQRKGDCMDALQNVRNENTAKNIEDRLKFLEHQEKQLNKVVMAKVHGEELPLPEELLPAQTLGEKIKGFIKKRGTKK